MSALRKPQKVEASVSIAMIAPFHPGEPRQAETGKWLTFILVLAGTPGSPTLKVDFPDPTSATLRH